MEEDSVEALDRHQVQRDMVVLLADGQSFAFLVTGPGVGQPRR